ncbi:hypothetical protein Acr_22g0007660 [Actinidia rufa]|uniref:Uncharacterized protein n=1 Tax=Actinidia rufa TaxID=165716 RepID=A0A7J0GKV2_9ERIC|nr:hypothetical protein Acr_22g0007660 [Actinidia rufa]
MWPQRGPSRVFKASTSNSKYGRRFGERQGSLSEVRRATTKPFEAPARPVKGHKAKGKPVRVKSTLNRSILEVRQGQSKPVELKSNLDRSRSRASSVRQPSKGPESTSLGEAERRGRANSNRTLTGPDRELQACDSLNLCRWKVIGG